MGCDIHLATEVYDTEAQKWVCADPIVPNPYYDPNEEDPFYRKAERRDPDWLYDGRNYDLFAILADVRNGRGFAGIKTGQGFNPIASPKGLPLDVSDGVLEWAESCGVDGHSHSYHTLTDLLVYDWTQQTGKLGVVDPWNFAHFLLYGEPSSWCDDVSGPGITFLDHEDMKTFVFDLMRRQDTTIEAMAQFARDEWFIRNDTNTYCRVSWDTSYSDAAGSFYTESLDKLRRLADERANGDPNLVRIVFWFDN